MNSISQLNHEGEFERAWADPSNTRFELPSVDVNRVLAEHYRTSEPLTFTQDNQFDLGNTSSMGEWRLVECDQA